MHSQYGTDGKYSESGTKAFLEPLKNGDAALFDALLAIAEKCNKEGKMDDLRYFFDSC